MFNKDVLMISLIVSMNLFLFFHIIKSYGATRFIMGEIKGYEDAVKMMNKIFDESKKEYDKSKSAKGKSKGNRKEDGNKSSEDSKDKGDDKSNV